MYVSIPSPASVIRSVFGGNTNGAGIPNRMHRYWAEWSNESGGGGDKPPGRVRPRGDPA
jgi:hypothetical protein